MNWGIDEGASYMESLQGDMAAIGGHSSVIGAGYVMGKGGGTLFGN